MHLLYAMSRSALSTFHNMPASKLHIARGSQRSPCHPDEAATTTQHVLPAKSQTLQAKLCYTLRQRSPTVSQSDQARAKGSQPSQLLTCTSFTEDRQTLACRYTAPRQGHKGCGPLLCTATMDAGVQLNRCCRCHCQSQQGCRQRTH